MILLTFYTMFHLCKNWGLYLSLVEKGILCGLIILLVLVVLFVAGQALRA